MGLRVRGLGDGDARTEAANRVIRRRDGARCVGDKRPRRFTARRGQRGEETAARATRKGPEALPGRGRYPQGTEDKMRSHECGVRGGGWGCLNDQVCILEVTRAAVREWLGAGAVARAERKQSRKIK